MNSDNETFLIKEFIVGLIVVILFLFLILSLLKKTNSLNLRQSLTVIDKLVSSEEN